MAKTNMPRRKKKEVPRVEKSNIATVPSANASAFGWFFGLLPKEMGPNLETYSFVTLDSERRDPEKLLENVIWDSRIPSRNPKLDLGFANPESRNPNPETQSWIWDSRIPNPEIRIPKPKVGFGICESRIQKSESRNPKLDLGFANSESANAESRNWDWDLGFTNPESQIPKLGLGFGIRESRIRNPESRIPKLGFGDWFSRIPRGEAIPGSPLDSDAETISQLPGLLNPISHARSSTLRQSRGAFWGGSRRFGSYLGQFTPHNTGGKWALLKMRGCSVLMAQFLQTHLQRVRVLPV